MRACNNNRVVILSACRNTLPNMENAARTYALDRDLNFMKEQGHIDGYARAAGMWRGESEASFVVVIPSSGPALDDLVGLARKYDQGSILVADEERRAHLIGVCDSTATCALPGRLRPMSIGEPMPDSCTVLHGVVYVVG